MAKPWTFVRTLLVILTVHQVLSCGRAAERNVLDLMARREILTTLSVSRGTAASNWPPVAVSVSASNWTAYATVGDARLGFAVASAGDVNGDGHGDIILGAPELDGLPGSGQNHGGVFIFLGTSNGLSSSISWFFPSPRDRAQMGFSVAGLGDINRDGFADVAFGAPRYDAPVSDAGASFILLGGNSLADMQPIPLAGPDQKRLRFGWSLAAAGDVNRDGFDDLLVGAPLDSVISRYSGAALLYLGANAATSWHSHWMVRGDASQAQLGKSLAGAGDVNGDGFPDVIVGAPQHDTKLRQTGRALVFQGSPNGPSPMPVWVADGSGDYGWFGAAVGGGTDLNRDGISDVFVAAPGYNRSFSSWPGEVNFYFGSTTGLVRSASIRLTGEQAGSQFGSAVAVGGDVNGDGLPDLLVGAPFYDSDQTDAGRVCLFLGVMNGFRARPDWVLDGGEAGARCGMAVAWVGDRNGDGFSDFVVGTPNYSSVKTDGGRVDLFYGSAAGYQGMEGSDASAMARRFESDAGSAATNSVTTSHGNTDPNSTPQSERRFFLTILLSVLSVGVVVYLGVRRAAMNRERDATAAVENERERLARDLHDDLGARLARISLLTELVKRDAGQSEEGKKNAQILAETAREVLGSMEQILWSVNPSNDTLENLVTFIVQYAGPFFAPTGITFRHDVPSRLPACIIQPETRKNFFLTIKEALNNIAKHSGATEARLEIHFTGSCLTVVIEDNGRGLPQACQEASPPNESTDQPRPRRGNGLGNMRARIEEIRGQFTIEPRSGGGTRVRLVVNL